MLPDALALLEWTRIPYPHLGAFWDGISNLGYLCLGFPICKIRKALVKTSYIAEALVYYGEKQKEPTNFDFHKRNIANINDLIRKNRKKQADV